MDDATVKNAVKLFAATLRSALPQTQAAFPDDQNYDEMRAQWNLINQIRPLGVVAPKTAQEVSQIITIARQAGIKQLNAMSGGHGFMGACLGGIGGETITIDCHNLNDLTMNGDIVEVGPGVFVGQLSVFLAKYNKMIPTGMCVNVCVGGQASAGGHGFYGRTYGTMLDHVVGFEIVLPSGECVKVSATENSDLYWAQRGNGMGNFGIVTKYYMRTNPMPKYCAYFQYHWPRNHPKAADIYEKVMNWQVTAPNQISPILNGWEGLIDCSGGIVANSEDELTALIKELDAAMPHSEEKLISRCGFLETVRWFGLTQTSAPWFPDLNSIFREGDRFLRFMKIKAGFMPKALDRPTIEKLIAHIQKQPLTGARVQVLGANPSVSQKDENDSCVKVVNAPLLMGMSVWIVSQGHSWAQREICMNEGLKRLPWLEECYEIFYPSTNGGYVGDDDLEEGENGRDMYQSYYGDKYAKLQQIKAKYDPDNLFHHIMSIQLPQK